MNYGFGVTVDKNTSYNESIHYKFDFFSDRDLRIQLLEQLRQEEDNFLIIREVYNETKDKDTAVHYIANYVKNQADKIQYRNKMGINTFKNILDRWIIKNSTGNFYSMCHNFTNSIQIIDWIYSLNSDSIGNANINDIGIVDNRRYNPIEKKVFSYIQCRDISNPSEMFNINDILDQTKISSRDTVNYESIKVDIPISLEKNNSSHSNNPTSSPSLDKIIEDPTIKISSKNFFKPIISEVVSDRNLEIPEGRNDIFNMKDYMDRPII